jgi:phosphohistidine phosphatase
MLQIEQMRAALQDLMKDLDFVLCSGMKRAKQTFQAIYSIIPAKTKFMFDDFLYQVSSSSLLDKIQWTPTIYDKILVIGHNPGLSQFLEEVAPGKNLKTMDICEVVVLDAHVKIWQEVSYNCLVERTRLCPAAQDD